jgi:hypothetical protein
MSLKINVNKIHSDLVENFESVEIFEKSSKDFQEYVEIIAVKENKKVIMILKKKELENNHINWSYYSNPDKKDFLIERNSTVESIKDDVQDIFEKNRFDSEYLEKIK